MIKCNGKDVIPRLNSKELSRVMYNGKQIYPVNNVIEVQLADVIAGDVCVYDGANKRFFRFVDSGATDNIKKYTPIGIVVIPASHDVYGDGSCAIISLVEMDHNTPDTGCLNNGSVTRTIFNRGSMSDERLETLNKVVYIATKSYNETNFNIDNNNVIGLSTFSDTYPFLPTDEGNENDIVNPFDYNTYYKYTTDSGCYVPSPYLYDNRNPTYYQTTSPSSNDNCLKDFNGINNTKVIIEKHTGQANWKTDDVIKIDGNTPYYFPAVCCSWRFHTKGTKQGDWYIPSIGELGYVNVRQHTIDNSIIKCNGHSFYDKYSNTSQLASSTLRSTTVTHSINLKNNQIIPHEMHEYIQARAFLRVGSNDIVHN